MSPPLRRCHSWRGADMLLLSARGPLSTVVLCSAPSVPRPVFTITEKAPTRAFSWLKAPTSAFTFKTLLRHYAKRALTPRSLNVKLGPRRNYHKGRAAIRHYANQPDRASLMTFVSVTPFHVYLPWGKRSFSIVS